MLCDLAEYSFLVHRSPSLFVSGYDHVSPVEDCRTIPVIAVCLNCDVLFCVSRTINLNGNNYCVTLFVKQKHNHSVATNKRFLMGSVNGNKLLVQFVSESYPVNPSDNSLHSLVETKIRNNYRTVDP